MDYQRPYGLIAALIDPVHNFLDMFTNVTSYNYGVVGAAAGFDLQSILYGAGWYNRTFGNPANMQTVYGLNTDRVNNINQGFNDYRNGKW
jgi:Bacterial toxin 44